MKTVFGFKIFLFVNIFQKVQANTSNIELLKNIKINMNLRVELTIVYVIVYRCMCVP